MIKYKRYQKYNCLCSTIIVLTSLFVFLFSVNASARNIEIASANIPIIVMSTNGNAIVDEPKITAKMRIIKNGLNQRNFSNADFTGNSGFLGIETLGNSTQIIFPKKPYLIEIKDINRLKLPIHKVSIRRVLIYKYK